MSAWLMNLFELFFGCCHSRTTFPLTARSSPVKPAAACRATYVVCLDCGKEFNYDWSRMRMAPTPVEMAAPQRLSAVHH